MSTPAAGIPGNEGQPNQGIPPVTGQPQGTPPPAQAEPPKQDNPQFAELQQKYATLEAEAKKRDEAARFYQSQFDKAQHQLRAVVGAQPQQDPHAEDIKFWVGRGYGEKEARDMVEYTASKIGGMQQQLQQAQQTIQATSAVGEVLQAAAMDPRFAPLFSDPDVQRQVHQFSMRRSMANET
jgi:hypothetical protein